MTDPRIRIVQESEATGETAQIYDEVRATFGMPFVPDIVKLVSIRPDFLRVLHDGSSRFQSTRSTRRCFG